jgi:hypothetical protein
LRFKGEWASAPCPLPTHKAGDKGRNFTINLPQNYWRCFSEFFRLPRQRKQHTNGRGQGKSSDFRLSQALAYGVVKKGGCGDFILCGLSPPVSASWSLVHRYTFLDEDAGT